jgi:hypothetical protein
MRILFIYPNINTQIGFNYGISYISSFLKANGIETYLLNINEKLGYPLDHERIKEDILSIKPDMIGFPFSQTSINMPSKLPTISINILTYPLYSAVSTRRWTLRKFYLRLVSIIFAWEKERRPSSNSFGKEALRA